MACGQGYDEGRSLSGGAQRTDLAPVPFDDAPADRQPYSAALILGPGYKPVEWLEDALRVLLLKADTVVFHTDFDAVRQFTARHSHHWLNVRLVVFESIAD